MDASLLANEVIDTKLKKKEIGVLCKLDIEKAYDQINWECIIKILIKMGFGAKWVNWVKRCISTASFSMLVNGSPIRFFSISKGLRQGDPLSPYLFIISMEVFSILVDKASFGSFLSGFKIANKLGEELQITHLLFADDTLVFCNDSRDH